MSENLGEDVLLELLKDFREMRPIFNIWQNLKRLCMDHKLDYLSLQFQEKILEKVSL